MKPKSAGVPIKQLILDLELAYMAACKARKFAHQLFVKAGKRNPSERTEAKKLAAKKQMSRATSNWNKISAELKRFQKAAVFNDRQIVDYSGFIVELFV